MTIRSVAILAFILAGCGDDDDVQIDGSHASVDAAVADAPTYDAACEAT